MTSVIHPAKSIAQKLIIDADAQILLAQACADHDIAKESMGTAANRLYSIGFRAEHLRAKDGDKDIIAIVDKAIVKTMPEQARKLLAAKPVDLSTTDKGFRESFIKNLADKRTALAKALAKCDDPEAGTSEPIDHASVLAVAIEKMKAKIHTLSVVDPKTSKCKLEGVKIGKLLEFLEQARLELT